MELKLIPELMTESKLVRSKSYLSKFEYRDILDFTFLYFLTFQILKAEPETKNFVKDYISRVTVSGPRFDNFKQHQNDFYQFLHILFGKNNQEALGILKKTNEQSRLVDNLTINMSDLNLYLHAVKFNKKRNDDWEHRFLLKLESDLMITESNYRAIRRLVRDWDDRDYEERSYAITRLLQAFRTRLRYSELLPILEKLSKKFRYEIINAKNPELNESLSFSSRFWFNARTRETVDVNARNHHTKLVDEEPELFGFTPEEVPSHGVHPVYSPVIMNFMNEKRWVRAGINVGHAFLQSNNIDDIVITLKYLNNHTILKSVSIDTDISNLPSGEGINLIGSQIKHFIRHGKKPLSKLSQFREAGGVGRITKQNTTPDVKPGETKRQAKKFGFDVDDEGVPIKLLDEASKAKMMKGLSTGLFWYHPERNKIIPVGVGIGSDLDHVSYVRKYPRSFGLIKAELPEVRFEHEEWYSADVIKLVSDRGWVRAGIIGEEVFAQSDNIKNIAKTIRMVKEYEPDINFALIDIGEDDFQTYDSAKYKQLSGSELDYFVKYEKIPTRSTLSQFRETIKEAIMLPYKEMTVWKNPSKNDILVLLTKIKELRGMTTEDIYDESKIDIFVWNAFEASHIDVETKLEVRSIESFYITKDGYSEAGARSATTFPIQAGRDEYFVTSEYGRVYFLVKYKENRKINRIFEKVGLPEARVLKHPDNEFFPKLYMNPSKDEIAQLLQHHSELRALITDTDDLYVWDSQDATHQHIEEEFYFDGEYYFYFGKFGGSNKVPIKSNFGTFYIIGLTLEEIRILKTKSKIKRILESNSRLSIAKQKTWDPVVESVLKVTANNKEFNVWKNPSKAEIGRLVYHPNAKKNDYPARALLHDGDIYMWDAWNATHITVAIELGITKRQLAAQVTNEFYFDIETDRQTFPVFKKTLRIKTNFGNVVTIFLLPREIDPSSKYMQYLFKDQINESKVEKIDVPGEGEIKLYKNPSKNEIAGLLQNSHIKELRALICLDSDLIDIEGSSVLASLRDPRLLDYYAFYVWDSYNATHFDVISALNTVSIMRFFFREMNKSDDLQFWNPDKIFDVNGYKFIVYIALDELGKLKKARVTRRIFGDAK